MNKTKSQYKKSIHELSLIDDFLFSKAMLNKMILPYDPFGKNLMIYHVKNIVEEIPEMNYNDGIRKIFLYTDGEKGGSDELKKLLSYIKQSRFENVTDERLKKLHYGVEEIKRNSETGVRYMQMWEIIELEKRESKAEGIEEGIEQGKTIGKSAGKTESILELLEDIGTIPDSLKETILSQKNMDILNKWLKLSAKVNTIDEFMEKMKL